MLLTVVGLVGGRAEICGTENVFFGILIVRGVNCLLVVILGVVWSKNYHGVDEFPEKSSLITFGLSTRELRTARTTLPAATLGAYTAAFRPGFHSR